MGVEGISTGGVNINIRYADDAVVMADTAEKLRALLDTVKRERERENGIENPYKENRSSSSLKETTTSKLQHNDR